MQFTAEIIEIKQRKTPSLDHEYTLKLVTDDKSIMALSAYPADTVMTVTIIGEGESVSEQSKENIVRPMV